MTGLFHGEHRLRAIDRGSTVVLAALTLVACATGTAAQEVVYSWESQTVEKLVKPKAGGTATLQVTDLNLACYRYRISANLQEAAEDVSRFTEIIEGASSWDDTVAVRPISKLPPGPDFQEDAGQLKFTPLGMSFILRDVGDMLTDAEARFAVLRSELERLERAVDRVQGLTCKAGRGRSVALAAASSTERTLSLARDLSGEARELRHELRWSIAALAEIGDQRRRLSRSLDSLGVPIRERRLAALERARALAERVESERLFARLDSLQSLALVMRGQAEGVLPATEILHPVHLGSAVEHVTFVIEARGLVPAVAGTRHVDSLHVPVDRRYRFSVSVGAMVSALDDRDYERQNVSRPGEDGGTISTFVDQEGARRVVHVPVALAHMTVLGSENGFSVAATGGTTFRSVDEQLLPELLLGATVLLRDMVGVTLAGHVGRREELLLGDPDSVAGRSVPAEVTREAAVGAAWPISAALLLHLAVP